jgi:hypothetical protein
VAKYIDERNHKLRYTLKNKGTDETYLVVLLTLLLHDSSEEVSERGSSGVENSDGEDKPKAGKQGRFDWETQPDSDDID